GEQLNGTSAGRGDLIELGLRACRKLAIRGCVLSRRAEDDVLIIGRERVRILGGGVECQPPRFAASRGHDVDVEVAVTIGRERDLSAVVTPYRHEIVRGMSRERQGLSAPGWNSIEISLVTEDDGLAVRRDRRVAHPARAFGRGGRSLCGERAAGCRQSEAERE